MQLMRESGGNPSWNVFQLFICSSLNESHLHSIGELALSTVDKILAVAGALQALATSVRAQKVPASPASVPPVTHKHTPCFLPLCILQRHLIHAAEGSPALDSL